MTKKRVVVLFGGRSAEREISLITGKQIIANLNRARYAVTPIEIPRTGNAWLNKLMRAKPDVVIPALHGPFGEDGTVQGMLEMLNIPYTFSGVLASALAMDKYRLIEFLRVHGVLAPRGVLLTNDEPSPIRAKRRMKKAHINFPCVVKPNRLGSSVGVTVNIKNMRDLGKALRLAFHCDSEVLVEEHIRGREITAPVLRPYMISPLARLKIRVLCRLLKLRQRLAHFIIIEANTHRGDHHMRFQLRFLPQ